MLAALYYGIALGLVLRVNADASTLVRERHDWPDAWFYSCEFSITLRLSRPCQLVRTGKSYTTAYECTGNVNASTITKFDNKCHELKSRVALALDRDPEPGASPNQGCLFLYGSDDCSEGHENAVHKRTISFTGQCGGAGW